MNKAENALYQLLKQERHAIKISVNPHKTAQEVADKLANLSNKGTYFKDVNVADTYENLIERLQDSMDGLRDVMPKADFIANGASNEDIKAMNASQDAYFINRNFDGVTPDYYKSTDAINRLTLFMQAVKD